MWWLIFDWRQNKTTALLKGSRFIYCFLVSQSHFCLNAGHTVCFFFLQFWSKSRDFCLSGGFVISMTVCKVNNVLKYIYIYNLNQMELHSVFQLSSFSCNFAGNTAVGEQNVTNKHINNECLATKKAFLLSFTSSVIGDLLCINV